MRFGSGDWKFSLFRICCCLEEDHVRIQELINAHRASHNKQQVDIRTQVLPVIDWTDCVHWEMKSIAVIVTREPATSLTTPADVGGLDWMHL